MDLVRFTIQVDFGVDRALDYGPASESSGHHDAMTTMQAGQPGQGMISHWFHSVQLSCRRTPAYQHSRVRTHHQNRAIAVRRMAERKL